MAAPATRYARNGDISIAYQVFGHGPRDLLFIPSWISQSEHLWTQPRLRRVLERMGTYARVILFDRRGSGMSDRVDPGPLEDQVDDIRTVLRAAGSERVVVWAETEGTAMACLFAAAHPELVSSLVLFTPLPRVLNAPDYPWASDPTERAALIQGFIEGWGSGAAGRPLAPSMADDPRFLEWFGRLERLSHGPAEVWLHMARMAETDVRAVLPSVQAPTLVLHREGDQMIDPRHARYVADKIPGAKLRTLPGRDSLVFAGDIDALSDAIEEFVTGVAPASATERVLATVLFTDVVDSTRRASELGDRRWRTLLDEHSELVRERLATYGGNEVKTLGDGFLSTFDGPARAVRCALDIVRSSEASGLPVRAGAHTGECEVSDDDVTGIAVHIASRVTSYAGSGEVVVSRTVTDLVAGSELGFESRGSHELKGVPGSWELYAAADT